MANDKLRKKAQAASGQSVDPLSHLRPKQEGQVKKLTFYMDKGTEGPELSRRLREICKDNNLTAQGLVWHALNKLFQDDFGYDYLPFPQDTRKLTKEQKAKIEQDEN